MIPYYPYCDNISIDNKTCMLRDYTYECPQGWTWSTIRFGECTFINK